LRKAESQGPSNSQKKILRNEQIELNTSTSKVIKQKLNSEIFKIPQKLDPTILDTIQFEP